MAVKNPQAPYGASIGRLENKLHYTFGKVSQPFSSKPVEPKETVSGGVSKAHDVVTPRSPLATTMRGIKNG